MANSNNRAYWDVKYFCVAKAEMGSDDTITYSGGAQAWDMIRVSVTPNVITAAHTSETGGRKTRYKVLGEDISLDHEPETLEKKALLFGHTLSSTGDDSGELKKGVNDLPQHVGAAYYKALNDDTYEATFFPYALFSEGTEQVDGALDGVTYNTKTTTGSAEADKDGYFEYTKSFATEALAIAWVKTKLSMT